MALPAVQSGLWARTIQDFDPQLVFFLTQPTTFLKLLFSKGVFGLPNSAIRRDIPIVFKGPDTTVGSKDTTMLSFVRYEHEKSAHWDGSDGEKGFRWLRGTATIGHSDMKVATANAAETNISRAQEAIDLAIQYMALALETQLHEGASGLNIEGLATFLEFTTPATQRASSTLSPGSIPKTDADTDDKWFNQYRSGAGIPFSKGLDSVIGEVIYDCSIRGASPDIILWSRQYHSWYKRYLREERAVTTTPQALADMGIKAVEYEGIAAVIDPYYSASGGHGADAGVVLTLNPHQPWEAWQNADVFTDRFLGKITNEIRGRTLWYERPSAQKFFDVTDWKETFPANKQDMYVCLLRLALRLVVKDLRQHGCFDGFTKY